MSKDKFQVIYGIVLIIAGVAVFLKIPYVMPEIMNINYFANAGLIIKLSFYLLGGLVVLAGVKKVFKFYKSAGDS